MSFNGGAIMLDIQTRPSQARWRQLSRIREDAKISVKLAIRVDDGVVAAWPIASCDGIG